MTYYISYRTRLKDPIDKYHLIIKDDINSSFDLMLLCRQIIRCGYRKISKKNHEKITFYLLNHLNHLKVNEGLLIFDNLKKPRMKILKTYDYIALELMNERKRNGVDEVESLHRSQSF